MILKVHRMPSLATMELAGQTESTTADTTNTNTTHRLAFAFSPPDYRSAMPLIDVLDEMAAQSDRKWFDDQSFAGEDK